MKRDQTGCENTSESHRPFERLRDMLGERHLKTRSSDAVFDTAPQPGFCLENRKRITERELFQAAMADVTPIHHTRCHRMPPPQVRSPLPDGISKSGYGCAAEQKVVEQLRRLVDCGDGFEVCQTPEYMEGRGYNVSREVTRRLYNGDFSIQEHIDLHGLNAADAREAFLAFMQTAIANGTRAVLVVHGRGLSSPVKPVLKSGVFSWLTRSRIRKWVIAFTSARSCDGGAGATYVLLRHRPVTKRFRKQMGKNPGKASVSGI